jgi:NADH-quinone oxidoreductase subunit C
MSGPATPETNRGTNDAVSPARPVAHPALPRLKEKFADVGLAAGRFRDMVTVRVPREHIVDVCTFLRDDSELQFRLLHELNGIDYLNYPGGAPGRFGLTYGLTSFHLPAEDARLWLKVFLDPERSTKPGVDEYMDEDAMEKADPGLIVDSMTGVFPTAEWHEREIYDMFGIAFRGHPDLRRLLTWNGFNARPLRKDYPLRGVGEREDYPIVSRETA